MHNAAEYRPSMKVQRHTVWLGSDQNEGLIATIATEDRLQLLLMIQPMDIL
jgi:hypothetical protein